MIPYRDSGLVQYLFYDSHDIIDSWCWQCTVLFNTARFIMLDTVALCLSVIASVLTIVYLLIILWQMLR